MIQYKRTAIIIAFAVAAGGSSAVRAQQDQQQPPPRSAPEWQQKYEELEQRQRILERKLELKQEADDNKAKEQEAKAKDTPILKAGADGFAIQSADSNFVLRLRGIVQADGRFYPDDKLGKGTDTFLLRRVRPIFEGTVFRDFDFRLMPDFGNGANSTNIIQDAYVEWKSFSWLKVRAGKFKVPIGLEWLQQDAWTPFAERGLPTDLVPQRDVGALVSGDLFDGAISYAGGIFNGVVDGGIADFDTWDSKDAAARVFLQPFKNTDINPLKGLGFGVGGSIGNQQFTSSVTNVPVYKTTGQLTFFSFDRGVALDGQSLRASPQGYYYWGPLGLLGEYVISEETVRRGAVVDQLRNDAWQVEGSFVLTGENAGYNGVIPRHPFDLTAGGWGAFEVVGRYGDLRIDPAAFSTAPSGAGLRFADPTLQAQEAREWGVGLNWYLNRNIKWLLDYEQTSFDGGAGSNATTPPTVANRQTERVIFTRVQLQF